MKVWVQKWEESEAGWGTRPDGYTLHLEHADINLFLRAMREREEEWAKKNNKPANYVPPEYSRPEGKPYITEVSNGELVDKIVKSQNGVWGPTGNKYPKPIQPGADDTGWQSREHSEL